MWSFAIINGKLAEIYFDKPRGHLKFRGHCYVERSEFKTKAELKAIDEDTKKVRLSYRKGIYRNLLEVKN